MSPEREKTLGPAHSNQWIDINLILDQCFAHEQATQPPSITLAFFIRITTFILTAHSLKLH